MIKRFLLPAAVLVISAVPILAQGIFGYGIELNASGAGATVPGLTLFALNDGGTTRLLPTGSGATLNETSWLSSPESGTPTFNLGTFNPSAGDALTLVGGSMLTFGSGFGNTTQYLNYRVSPLGGSFASFPPGSNLSLNLANVNGMTNDNRWSNESLSINLLSGLTPGTYILGTYGYANDGSDVYAGNNGANYGATFTIVPEPSILSFLGGSSILGAFMFLRRRRAS